MESIPILSDFCVSVRHLEEGVGTFVASLEDREMIVLNNEHSKHEIMYWQDRTDAVRWNPRLVSAGTTSSMFVFEPMYSPTQFMLLVGSSETCIQLTWPFVSGLFRTDLVLPKMRS